MDKINVYLEAGDKKTIAVALDWPGWARIGKDADSALGVLLAYGPRYAEVMRRAEIAFAPPAGLSGLVVAETLQGTSATDFGVPHIVRPEDAQPVGADEQRRLEAILRACFHALDAAVDAAQGKELRKGPRGGGRELEAITRHVLESNEGYLTSLGWKKGKSETAGLRERIQENLEAVLEGMRASIRGETETQGPRGGKRWPARYFARRVGWHVLDHVWEIQDRLVEAG